MTARIHHFLNVLQKSCWRNQTLKRGSFDILKEDLVILVTLTEKSRQFLRTSQKKVEYDDLPTAQTDEGFDLNACKLLATQNTTLDSQCRC